MSEWIEYTGSDKQIEEIRNAEHGFIVSKDGQESRWFCHGYTAAYVEKHLSAFTHYLVCNPHPLANMIKRWADTGQPVWIRLNKPYSIRISDYENHPTTKLMVDSGGVYLISTAPDWNIPGAEYS